MAAIEDITSGNRQEEEAARPTATTTTSASPEPSQDSRGDLERKVVDLQSEVERQKELVSDYQRFCMTLEGDVRKAFLNISELTNETRNLREEVNKHKEYIKDQLPMVFDDVIALRGQVARLEPLKDQVAKLEQELESLRREVIMPTGTVDSPDGSGLGEA